MSAATEDVIPHVDLSPIAADRPDSVVTETDLLAAGNALVSAFTSIGFCFVDGHGISNHFLDECLDNARRFFDLPMEVKRRVLRQDGVEDFTGWLPGPQVVGVTTRLEQQDKTRPADYKETFNMRRCSDNVPTDEELPGFRADSIKLLDAFDLLLRRSLHAIGLALGLEQPKAMLDLIREIGTNNNDSILRYAFYPRLFASDLLPGQMRCSDHTDFGFITLLFQNSVRGLQVQTRAGDYVDAPPSPGSILFNVGDTLERLSGGVLRSARHQVLLDEETASVDRFSVIYFPASDRSAILKPLCGDKEKYGEVITSGEFARRKAVAYFSDEVEARG